MDSRPYGIPNEIYILFDSVNFRCGCLREIEYHDSDVIERFKNENLKENINDVWNRETCTIQSGPTNAFGIFYLNYFSF